MMSVTMQSLVYELKNSPAKLVLTVDRPAPPLTWTNPIIFVIVIYSFVTLKIKHCHHLEHF
jgi:hypothetical protein